MMNFRWRQDNAYGVVHHHNQARRVAHVLNPANGQIQVDIPPLAMFRRHAELPMARQVQSERIDIDGNILSYAGNRVARVGTYIAANPLTSENNYFEVEILDCGIYGAIGVGLVCQRYSLDAQPGWKSDSIGYHADDGKLFKASGHGRLFGPKCVAGDKIGCGIKYEQIKIDHGSSKQIVPVFFTRNGKEIGTVLVPVPSKGFYPAVGMHSEGEKVCLILEAEWEHGIGMSVDNSEEDWARLHDVKILGQMLEYAGRGKSIMDVGLAQARQPLSTRNHYFEIEIADPGENCYIAIGLARKDYPKHRHPGWNTGSIAYHADDGKIFIGSGVGDPFGPRCHKGDTMGCGILFPREYTIEFDSISRKSADSDAETDDFIEVTNYPSSESDDDDWWGPDSQPNTGTKVQVFFTRNGKTVGKRDVHIPHGGFFPTVGMLSSDEKILVDLHPLTG